MKFQNNKLCYLQYNTPRLTWMTMLTLMSFALGCFCTLSSPYFYDKDFDKGLMKIVNDGIQEQCTPLNMIKLNENIEESKNPVVFAFFDNYRDVMTCSLFTEGKRTEKIAFKNKISMENYASIVKDVVKRVRKLFKIIDFDIFFTVDPICKDLDFFKEDNFKNSVDLIKDSFRSKMKEGSIVNYYNRRYVDSMVIPRLRGPDIDKVVVLKYKNGEDQYLVLLDSEFFKKVFNKLEAFINSYEEKILGEFLEKHEIKATRSEDLHVLLILYNISESFNDELNTSKATFLVKIWDFLINKKGFDEYFEGLLTSEENKEKIVQQKMLSIPL